MKKIYSIIALFIGCVSQQTSAQANETPELSFASFPKVIKQNSTETIAVNFKATAHPFNQTVLINYAIDNVIISSENVQLNLQKNASQQHKISYDFYLKAKEYTLKVWITDPLITDISKALNTIESSFWVARTTVPQLPLIEEFTSSTCGPCASFNSTFDPFLGSINANENGGQVAAVKYQMNWPPPGDDPSYNSDGNGRKNSYGVGGIPKSYLNGIATSTFDQSVIDAASGESAFMLVPYFYLSGDTVKAFCNAVSYTSMTGSLRLHLALTEDFYAYTGGTTSQNTFHFVTRKMLPNYVGTILNNIHEDTTYTTTRNFKVTYDTVTQNSYNIWSTSAGFTLVAWIQNTSTKEVYQAAFANTPSALSLAEKTNKKSMEVFPNPANERFTIALALAETATVSYTLTDINGKLIQQPVTQELPAGKHLLQTSTQGLLPGIYICSIKANETVFNERIVITE